MLLRLWLRPFIVKRFFEQIKFLPCDLRRLAFLMVWLDRDWVPAIRIVPLITVLLVGVILNLHYERWMVLCATRPTAASEVQSRLNRLLLGAHRRKAALRLVFYDRVGSTLGNRVWGMIVFVWAFVIALCLSERWILQSEAGRHALLRGQNLDGIVSADSESWVENSVFLRAHGIAWEVWIDFIDCEEPVWGTVDRAFEVSTSVRVVVL